MFSVKRQTDSEKRRSLTDQHLEVLVLTKIWMQANCAHKDGSYDYKLDMSLTSKQINSLVAKFGDLDVDTDGEDELGWVHSSGEDDDNESD